MTSIPQRDDAPKDGERSKPPQEPAAKVETGVAPISNCHYGPEDDPRYAAEAEPSEPTDAV